MKRIRRRRMGEMPFEFSVIVIERDTANVRHRIAGTVSTFGLYPRFFSVDEAVQYYLSEGYELRKYTRNRVELRKQLSK